METPKHLEEESVKVDVADETGEALKREAEGLLKLFEASKEARGYKAGFLGAVVLHSARAGESLVVMKLQAEKHPGDDTDVYAAFMLAHKDGTPVEQLCPLGYSITHSLGELEMFIANLDFDLTVWNAGANGPSGVV